MMQKSHDDRMLWAQFDSLEMGTGWDDTDIEKPQIMVESVYGDSHPGSWHLNQLVEQAVYGVYEKGGKPAKYYATDICDGCAQGHDGMNVVLASREALANMVEVHASAVPWDGMILTSSCDKSIPAHLKAAARMDIPTIFMPGGSMRPGPNMTTSLVAGDISLRQKRKDAITPQEVRDYKLTGCPSVGACTFLGTASTMQCIAEALGMTLPGAALAPATMRDIIQYARYAGRKIMELVEKDITASKIMTPAAFKNAIIVHSAIGGSTNATIHLPSIARELGYGDREEFWGIVGLLHDLDFERWPEEHCKKSQELMRQAGVEEEIVRATASHGWGHCVDIKPEQEMEKVLFAVDELTGLIGAAALMRPSKSVSDMELKSLKKKFKDKKFAAGCSRDVIAQGAELLGWELDQLLDRTLAAMRAEEAAIEAAIEEAAAQG